MTGTEIHSPLERGPRVSWLGVVSCLMAVVATAVFFQSTHGSFSLTLGWREFGFSFSLENPLALWVRIGVPAALVAGVVLAVLGYRRGPERISPIAGMTLNGVALVLYLALLGVEATGASLAG
jgi:bacteriorhodopsin